MCLGASHLFVFVTVIQAFVPQSPLPLVPVRIRAADVSGPPRGEQVGCSASPQYQTGLSMSEVGQESLGQTSIWNTSTNSSFLGSGVPGGAALPVPTLPVSILASDYVGMTFTPVCLPAGHCPC